MIRKLCFLSLALFLFICLDHSAQACSCVGGGTPCQAFGNASAVFTGTVIAVKSKERTASTDQSKVEWYPRVFKFSVEQPFLGIDGREVEISTGMGGGDCGYGFIVGERYLVYAYRANDSNRLVTGICTRTAPIAKAEKDLEFLRGLSSLAPGVTIYGEVKRSLEDVPKGDSAPVGPLANIALTLDGKDVHKEFRTDADGRYRLSGLSPGTFKITLQLPDELTTYKTEQEVTVADRGCAAVNYSVVDNGRISGTVVDANGQPAAKVLVALVEADHVDPEKYWSKLEPTDEKGTYTFTSVPPGRYLIAVNLMRFPQQNDPTNAFPRTFYPGVADEKRAEAIVLGAGEKLSDKDLRLNRRSESVISGKVVWDDGQPVAKGAINFRDVTYHDARMDQGVTLDEQGYFEIKGYVGQTFFIAARSDPGFSPDPHKERSTPVRLTLANPTELVKIVITRVK